MFFSSLSQSISKAFGTIKGKIALTSKDFDGISEEIFAALIDADVSVTVAKGFIDSVKSKVIEKKIITKLSPANAIMKIVKEEITLMLGTEFSGINLSEKPPIVILMVGLQGSGKTTSSAKLALYLKKKFKKNVLLASLDIYRPAAQEQLQLLGEKASIDSLEVIEGQKPEKITERAISKAKSDGYDVVILDSAGRLHIDNDLMQELQRVKTISKPDEILLVIDSMTGQDSINIVSNFNNTLELSGVILSRMDGDSKGGVAISVRYLTNCPIKFFGSGENIEDLEEFYPDRIASRIIGMGDITSLMEKASEKVAEDEVTSLKNKIAKGEFDFNDLAWQFKMLSNLGGISKILSFIPGMNALNAAGKNKIIDNSLFRKNLAIINSMTKIERKNPNIINMSRRSRIAKGSGVKVDDVNILMKQFSQAKKLFSAIGKDGMDAIKNVKPETVMKLFGKK